MRRFMNRYGLFPTYIVLVVMKILLNKRYPRQIRTHRTIHSYASLMPSIMNFAVAINTNGQNLSSNGYNF